MKRETLEALYDHPGTGADELSFRQGDIVEVLTKPDASGWGEGRLDGRVGQFPANFMKAYWEKEKEKR